MAHLFYMLFVIGPIALKHLDVSIHILHSIIDFTEIVIFVKKKLRKQ